MTPRALSPSSPEYAAYAQAQHAYCAASNPHCFYDGAAWAAVEPALEQGAARAQAWAHLAERWAELPEWGHVWLGEAWERWGNE
jgi:hypothetical protein